MRVVKAFAALLALCGCVTTEAPDRRALNAGALPETAVFRAARPAPPARSNAQMARDFLDLSFEMESGRELSGMSRFEGPITVAITPGAPPSLSADLDRLLSRLRGEAGIDITRTDGQAAITIETLPRARMQRIVPQAACFVVPRVSSWTEFRNARGSSLLDWTTLTTRERVAIFIPSDVPPQEIRDCLHEELGQAIGPLNDLYRLPDSVFNDDNFHAILTGFDMLMLQVYYSPDLASGMSRDAAAERVPGILARLNPRGAGGGSVPLASTPRDWVTLIETALGGNATAPARQAAMRDALQVAQSRGWSDTRLGFAYFALGRLSLGQDQSAASALTAFQAAGAVFDRLDPGGIHAAHVDMQLAAFALSAGDGPGAIRLTEAALPAARRAENAALMATLMMIQAEALTLTGRTSEAQSVRIDSLRWARYGFGDSDTVAARMAEIAALTQ
ncbi:MAG: DUF2927 domain-containing protein [Pseudomonadota bacterium]